MASVTAQAVVMEDWVERYHFGDFDYVNGMAIDAAGNVYVTGRSRDPANSSNGDIATIKYGPDGTALWIKRYDSSGLWDSPWRFTVDSAGNAYVAGSCDDAITIRDWCILKYDTEGNELWVARYGSGPGSPPSDDIPFGIAVDAAGNVYVTGKIWSENLETDYATIKYDSEGAQLSVSHYDNNGEADSPRDIAVDSAGNVYVTGLSNKSNGNPWWDFATVKYYSNGEEAWVSRYSVSDTQGATAIAVDDLGNVYVTGSSGDFDLNDYYYVTIKYDPADGSEVWVRKYGGGVAWRSDEIFVDTESNVYVTGTGFDTVTGGDYATIKYDSDGILLWARHYDYAGADEEARELYVDAAGSVYVTGFASDPINGRDFATIKYDASGNELWVHLYDHNGQADEPNGLAVDNTGNVYVSGPSVDLTTGTDFATVKYVQDSDDDGIPDGFDNCPLESNPEQENYDGDPQGDVCDPDDDNDGILDVDDPFPMSESNPTVVINGCDSGMANLLVGGASFNDLIGQCVDQASNLGRLVRCVTALGTDWQQAGLITGEEFARLVNAAVGVGCLP